MRTTMIITTMMKIIKIMKIMQINKHFKFISDGQEKCLQRTPTSKCSKAVKWPKYAAVARSLAF